MDLAEVLQKYDSLSEITQFQMSLFSLSEIFND